MLSESSGSLVGPLRAGGPLATAGGGEPPTVVLLHGLGRTRHSMAGLARHLRRAGFPTWARSYPSRRLSIAGAADLIASWIERDLPGRPLVAVTHSLGGILVRQIGARLRWSRIVMLAPPNQGSRLSRDLRGGGGAIDPLFRWIFGPAGQEMAAPEHGRAWPAPTAPCAVIAGTRARGGGNPTSWLSRRRACFADGEPNDGTLAVGETRLADADMAAFATVDASHTWIMNHPAARAMVVAFLRGGRLAP